MAVPSRYPPARWLGDGKTSGPYTGGPWKLVLHTTETRGRPGYKNGYSAPHLTYDPRARTWYQHTALTLSARSLRNAKGGPETNRDEAIQVEIICYSNEKLAVAVGGVAVSALSPEALTDIREFILWTHENFGVELEWPEKQAYSYSQANATGFRMSRSEWDSFGGVCGHQHVPEGNTHWDPGALDWASLFPAEDEMAITKGAKGSAVKTVQEALLEDDPEALPTFGVDSDFGGETELALKAYQQKAGLPVTGKVDGLTAAFLVGKSGATKGPAGPPGKPGRNGTDGTVEVFVNGVKVD